MAAVQPAAERIMYLLGRGWHGYTGSPSTISSQRSGDTVTIFSYALPIASLRGDTLSVSNIRSSPTTNRHISAAHMVGRSYGLISGETANGWTIYTLT